ILSKALEDDLAKLAESRSSIDGLVAGQVEKLAEGRDILKRALESDLNTIKSVISDQSEKLVEDRSILSKALEDDLAKLAESRS
ncbi:MAG: hypothetical protein E5X64_44375, partial [Mesorhizobium sp.]